MSDKNDIKRCPFCGGEAEVYTVGFGNFIISCRDCPVNFGSDWYWTKEEVIREWNKRV